MAMLRHLTLKLLLVLCAGLALSSCVTMAVESEFEGDGTARHSMAVTIDTSMLGSLGEEFDPAEGLEETEQAAEQEGYEVEQIRDGDIVGVRISTEVEDTTDLGQILNDLYNANTGETTATPVTPFAGSFTEEDGRYRLELTVDGTQLLQGAGEGLNDGQSAEDFGFDLTTMFELSYTAHMPGEVVEDETNGEIIDGDTGRVTWELPTTGTTTLNAVSVNDDDSGSILALLIVGAIILLGLLGIGVVAFLVFMGRRKPSPAPAGSGSPDTGPPAPARPYGPAAAEPGSAPGSVSPAEQPTRPIPPPPPPTPDSGDDSST